MIVQLPLRFPNATILCIGDVMLDHFIYGQVDRISPESPVPVLRQQHQFHVLGGAGNVMRNIVALGGKAVFVSIIGQDKAGEIIQKQLDSTVNVEAKLFIEPHRQTIQKTRFSAQGQQLLRVDEEIYMACTDETEQKIIKFIESYLPICQAVVLSDYDKGIFGSNLSQILIKSIQNSSPDLPIIVDPKGQHDNRYEGATVITPNLKELIDMAGRVLKSQEEIILESQKIQKNLSVKTVLVTQGAKGMILVEENKEAELFPAKTREVYDVSGAGDTVVATLALGLASGYSLKESCYLANEAAGLVVGKVGTATISINELEDSLNKTHGVTHSQNIMDVYQVQDLLKLWRFQGLKIGFTNGCFDLLHLGHLHILHKAAQACDKLIVGVNTDSSVKRLKGQRRPIQSQETRTQILAALNIVDAVILFEEDTPLELIKILQPDILIKGADYTVDQVVGADLIQARGGKIILVDLKEGYSTTSTISRIQPTQCDNPLTMVAF